MIASLVLAASLMGQLPDNAGKLWTRNGYVLATLDVTKPLKFRGGPISCDLVWDASMLMFQSDPVDVGGRQARIQFWANPKFDRGQVWILYVQGIGGSPDLDDSDYVFDSASASPLNVSSTTGWDKGWSLNRAGATTYTLTQ